jgi:predicted nucleic acid-binding protein
VAGRISQRGATLDTGALIALERGQHRMRNIADQARQHRALLTVPAAVMVDWWRGRTDVREDILRSIRVEPLHVELARVAGEALAAVPGATAIDAVVMASAAQRGDVVYTSDVDDLELLRARFPDVRVLRA